MQGACVDQEKDRSLKHTTNIQDDEKAAKVEDACHWHRNQRVYKLLVRSPKAEPLGLGAVPFSVPLEEASGALRAMGANSGGSAGVANCFGLMVTDLVTSWVL